LPLQAYAGLLQGAVGSETAIINSLVYATPLILGGLSVAFGFRAGLFNIGAQGQFLLGLLGAVWVGVTVAQMSPVIAITLALVGGVLAGAFWGFIPGLLKAVSGAHEVVTTIMLNYVAAFLLAWAVSFPLNVPGAPAAVTGDVGNAALPILIGRNGHLGLLLALIAVGVVSFVLFKTTFGFEVRTVGANAEAARYAGMRPRRLIVLTMSICGALAGLAGAIEMLGIAHRTQTSYATSVGFDSIAIALLGRSSPIGVLAAALLFGAMRAGAGLMQLRTGIPIELIDVLQATILLFLVANPVLRKLLKLRNVNSGVGTGDQITQSYGKEAVS
jgi:simple sugar transport system permease protein